MIKQDKQPPYLVQAFGAEHVRRRGRAARKHGARVGAGHVVLADAAHADDCPRVCHSKDDLLAAAVCDSMGVMGHANGSDTRCVVRNKGQCNSDELWGQSGIIGGQTSSDA